MIEKLSINLSKHRIEKEKDLFSQAKILHENKKYDGCINRSYYAIFNAIRSLIAFLKVDSSKHSGVLSLFDRYFIKTGVMDKSLSKIAHLAFDSRQEFDYEDFYSPNQKEAKRQLDNCKRFIDEATDVFSKIIHGKIDLLEIEEKNI